MTFETEHLRLRRFVNEDWTHLYALDNDAEVMKFINGGLPVSEQEVREQILPVFLAESPAPFGFYAAIERQTKRFVGWCSLRLRADDESVAELGYRFHRFCWGRGYGARSAACLIDRAFTASTLQRVIATTYEDNVASRRVMENLGMRQVRSFRLGSAESDTAAMDSDPWPGLDVEYALDRQDWRHGTPE